MSVIHIDGGSFQKEVAQSDVPVIIDFFAEWCGPCQMMKPEFEALSKEYEGRLKFAKVDTDENQELAANFKVEGIPCLVITKKGKEIGRIVGYMPKAILKQRIEKFLA